MKSTAKIIMKNILSMLMLNTLLFVPVLLTTTSCNDDDDNKNDTTPQQVQSATDQTFMTNVAYSNRAEIELGQLAATKGQHDSVRAFGQHMVDDHSTAQNELKNLAASKNYAIPDTLDAAHKSLKQMLMSLSGYAFDSTYMSNQVKDHQKTLQDFQTEISQGQDQDVKNYANRFKPHIQMHLNNAVIIQDTLTKSKE